MKHANAGLAGLVLGLAVSGAAGAEAPAQAAMASDLDRFAVAYTAAWNSHEPEAVAEFYAADGALTINGGEPAIGREAVAGVARAFMEAFPDLALTFDGLERVGDRLRYHWTLVGTNTGPGGTGNAVDFSGYEAWIMADDGLIQDSQGSYDDEDYQRQLRGE
jgi:uncharacterized protein (TIGR02246 family)